MRISRHLKRLRQDAISKSITSGAGIGCEPTPIKLPEIQLSIFDATLENWHSFFDSFTATIDRNERLTPVQKFQYLRSPLTGKAARSIQSLDTKAINYPIAIDILKDKFDCHRQLCMRHWDFIFDYPKITKETPEAIDDFLETVKVNLKALEKLGEPITSNVVLIKLFTSKLPSAIIRKWQLTLPDKKMPSYQHLVEFLETRTNGDRANSTSIAIKKEPEQHTRQKQHAPRIHTFAITHRTLACPTCKGPHAIWHCDVFKAKSAENRLKIAKRALHFVQIA
jgi:hypothetical protein